MAALRAVSRSSGRLALKNGSRPSRLIFNSKPTSTLSCRSTKASTLPLCPRRRASRADRPRASTGHRPKTGWSLSEATWRGRSPACPPGTASKETGINQCWPDKTAYRRRPTRHGCTSGRFSPCMGDQVLRGCRQEGLQSRRSDQAATGNWNWANRSGSPFAFRNDLRGPANAAGSE
jgi:hypothetical protein